MLGVWFHAFELVSPQAQISKELMEDIAVAIKRAFNLK